MNDAGLIEATFTENGSGVAVGATVFRLTWAGHDFLDSTKDSKIWKMGDRVMFPIGIVFPLSTVEPASFEFLGRFSADAPFKMSAKHFMVGVIANPRLNLMMTALIFWCACRSILNSSKRPRNGNV